MRKVLLMITMAAAPLALAGCEKKEEAPAGAATEATEPAMAASEGAMASEPAAMGSEGAMASEPAAMGSEAAK